MKIKNAQATIEFTLIFVIIIALLASLFTMWKWSTDSIVSRQKWYNANRVEAGYGPNTEKESYPIKPPSVNSLTDRDMNYPED